MLLVADVGNTNTKIGVFDGDRLVASWRLTTRREQTADEYGVFIQTLLGSRGVAARAITGIAISNVVPPVQQALARMGEDYFGRPALFVEPDPDGYLPLAVDAPREVGPDRVVAAVAAREIHGAPVIVVDLGTATRFDCVNARGEFVGGAIAPGIAISVDALLTRAARLSRVELTRPKEAIGRNTTTNIQSGVVFGYAGLVDGLVDRMVAELGGEPAVVATGGLAPLIAGVSRTIQRVDDDLKLTGLRILHARGGLR